MNKDRMEQVIDTNPSRVVITQESAECILRSLRALDLNIQLRYVLGATSDTELQTAIAELNNALTVARAMRPEKANDGPDCGRLHVLGPTCQFCGHQRAHCVCLIRNSE